MPKNFDDPTALRGYVTQINDEFDKAPVVKIKPPRQRGYNLYAITGKIQGGVEGLQTLMKKIFGRNTTTEQVTGELAEKISGKYDAFVVTMENGEGFYFRSEIGDRGALTDKDFTPNKLGLAGQTFSKTEHLMAIKKTLHVEMSASIPIEILELAKQLLDVSMQKGAQLPTTPSIMYYTKVITPSDLKKLGKNFGEVVIANWCLYNKPDAERIEYPLEEANPLADFIVHFTKRSKKAPLQVSAKFEKGANASVSSIIPKGSPPPEGATKEEIMAYDAIMAVTYDPIIPGLLHAEEILQTPEYKALKKMIGGAVTLTSISALVARAMAVSGITAQSTWQPGSKESQVKYALFLQQLAPFYDAIQGVGQPDIKSFPKILANGPSKLFHPILYACSVALAKRFNTQKEFASILDKAARSIKAEQLYLIITPAQLEIKVKKFQEFRFEFAAGAFSYNAGNVRMKVKMVQ